MNEYSWMLRVLCPTYQADSQMTLSESDERKAYPVNIIEGSVKDYKVYRFDLKKENFLPFFNKCHDSKDKSRNAPKGLNSFCDYVIFATRKDVFYILLIELKSGDTTKARRQLDASELLIKYFCESAHRVCGYAEGDFNKEKIRIRKIIYKNGFDKSSTNVRDDQPDWEGPYWITSGEQFRLGSFCR